MTDNSIADNLGSLTVLTNLKDLDLSGNRITDLAQLEPLTELQQLNSIDISGCPVEIKDSVSVRKSIFEMLAVLPALKYVNGEDLLGNGTFKSIGFKHISTFFFHVVDGVSFFIFFTFLFLLCNAEKPVDDDDGASEEEEENEVRSINIPHAFYFSKRSQHSLSKNPRIDN